MELKVNQYYYLIDMFRSVNYKIEFENKSLKYLIFNLIYQQALKYCIQEYRIQKFRHLMLLSLFPQPLLL